MKNLILSVLLVILFVSCNSKGTSSTNIPDKVVIEGPKITVYETFAELAPHFQNKNDSIYVVNFWATTCLPCIKEMPHLEALEEKYKTTKLRVLLVSLNLKKNIDLKVKPFLEKHQIKPEVVLLADQNYSAWTDYIDKSWYGALPATLILKNDERKFIFGAFETFDDLEKVVLPFLNSSRK